MKRFLIAVTLAVSTMSTPAFSADVGVSVSIGQPGFYGRIDIGNYPYPQPRVIYTRPRIIERVYVEREPIYLRVPPGHSKNWGRYCHKYNACGEYVYFVQDNWYQREYAPTYREYHRDNRYGHGDDNRGNNRGDYEGERRGNSRGDYDEHRGNNKSNRHGH